MSKLRLDLESVQFLAIFDGENVVVRCQTELTDLGETESVDGFIARKGGPDAAVAYLRKVLSDDTRRTMRWPIRD